MALITGDYQHPNYDIEVQVLQPTVGESSYKEGRKVQVEWDNMLDTSTGELGKILKWLGQVKRHIGLNYDRKGKRKSTFTEFEYKP